MKLTCFLVAVLFYNSSHAQMQVDRDAISGTWKLSRTSVTKNGSVMDDSLSSLSSFFEFFTNGTYRSVEIDNNSRFVTKGKWKIIERRKKLHLFNNVDIPNDPKVEIGDHDMNILFIDGRLYLTYTYNDVLFPPQTDYYKKQ